MRLALVVERFEPNGGGVEAAVWQTARCLARAGDEVHVFAREGAAAAGVTLHLVPAPTWWQPLRVATFVRRTARALGRERFDLIHSFCRALRQDLFHAGGGSHAEYMKRTYGARGAALRRASPRHALQLSLEQRIFDDPAQHVQCVSEMVRDEIARRFGVASKRLSVVHYGVDTERFAPRRDSAERTSIRRELGAGDSNVWVSVGSGWRRKGVDTAMRALAAARDERSQLWIAGRDGTAPWQRLAERLGISERVRFVGNRDDMPSLYAAADGLMLPTRYDAFALVCLEAAASGLAVVTSGAAGAAELLGDAAHVVADPEDHAGFAAAIDALNESDARDRCGERGLRVARAHTWPVQTEKLRALYREIAR